MTPIPVEEMPDAPLANRPTSLGSTASWRTSSRFDAGRASTVPRTS